VAVAAVTSVVAVVTKSVAEEVARAVEEEVERAAVFPMSSAGLATARRGN